MRRHLAAGVFHMVVLAFLSSNHVDAFAPRPSAVTPSQVRSVMKVARRVDPFSIARWERPNDVETELVDDDAFDVRFDSLNQMQTKYQNPIVKSTMNPTPALYKYFQETSSKNVAFACVAALALTLFLTPLPSMAEMSCDHMGGSFSARKSSSSGSVMRSGGGDCDCGYSQGFSAGYAAGYYSRGPSIMINPFPIMPITPVYSPTGYESPGVVPVSRGAIFVCWLLLLFEFTMSANSSIDATLILIGMICITQIIHIIQLLL